jgi:ferrous iron transport protein B
LPSSFQLELPPYRRPQIGRVIVRSIFDRTLFVLRRAAAVAAPAGAAIWAMANISVNGVSVLAHCAGFLDPFARLMGLDGVILTAFILGFPANEIVVPIVIMSYMAAGSLTELASLADLRALFGGQRLDLAYRRVRDALFPYALAVRYDVHHDQKGDREP